MKKPRIIQTRGAAVTRILAPEELNARRKRKAFTTPLTPPNQALEPARNGRRTVDHPSSKLNSKSCRTEVRP